MHGGVGDAARRQVPEQRRGGGLLLLLVTAGGVRGGVDGVPALEEAVDERVAQRPRCVHHAHDGEDGGASRSATTTERG